MKHTPRFSGARHSDFLERIKEPGATVTRYVVTYINSDGLRTILGPAQGRFTHATAEEAAVYMKAVVTNNPASTIAMLYGDNPRFEVRPCKCWAGHFDPVSIYFD